MSLRARLAIAFSVVVALGVGAASTISYYSTRAELNTSLQGFLYERATELADGARQLPRQGERRNRGGDTPDLAIGSPFDPDAVTQVLDPDGNVSISGAQVLPVSAPEAAVAERDEEPIHRTIAIDGENFEMITLHIDGGGAIQVARSLAETEDVLRGLRDRLFLVGCTVSALAAVIGWIATSRSTRSLRSLTSTAERVATTHDLQASIQVSGRDEVGRLATSFDEMLRALRSSQEQQQRLIQDAGHELRTPLTTLRANIELLERAPDLGRDQRAAILTSLRTELSEMTDLYAEIIELATDARAEAPIGPLDLADAADAAARTFGARSERALELDLSSSPVEGNGELLERAITNLLHNADKYSPSSEPIRLIVDDGQVVVEDHGPGIPDHDRERIFDRFHRGESARSLPGSGLGLAIVKQIVDQHRGVTLVDDRAGGGARMGFRLRPL